MDGTVRGPGPRVPGGTVSEAQLARRLTKGKHSRRMLSNKPQDFQVGRPESLVLPPYCPTSGNLDDTGKDLFLWAVTQLVKKRMSGHIINAIR